MAMAMAKAFLRLLGPPTHCVLCCCLLFLGLFFSKNEIRWIGFDSIRLVILMMLLSSLQLFILGT